MRFISYLLITIFLSTSVFAENDSYFPNEDTLVDGTIIPDDTNGTKAIPNDQMPDKNITGSFRYSNETGVVRYIFSEDESGSVFYIDPITKEKMDISAFKNKPQSLINSEKAYQYAIDNNLSLKKIIKAQNNLEKEIQDFNHESGLNVLTIEKNTNITSARSSAGAMISDMLNPDKKDLSEQEKNATKFLSKNYSTNPDLANKDKIDDTVSDLADVYQSYSKLESELLSKEPGGSLKCFITRELIPSYYCSFPDMQGAFYPKIDTIKNGKAISISSTIAKDSCESACYKKRGVVSTKLFPESDISFINDKDITILPYSKSNSSLDIVTEKKSRIEYVEYDIVVEPLDSNLSTNEFNDILRTFRPALKYRSSVAVKDIYEDTFKVVVKLLPNKILSSSSHQKVLIRESTDKLKLFFYRPYSKEVFKESKKQLELAKILKVVKSIKIKNIRIVYASNKLFFCPLKQMVDSSSECDGEILDIASNSGIYHICTDSRHKIGDDILTGGFFTEQAAIDSCLEFKECKPSYRHYQNMSATQIFKTTIGCVDSVDNPSCTDDMCRAYFADYDTMPVNEVVIQNDHTRIPTIRSKVVQKGVTRPKINYAAEASGLVDALDTTFMSEMKDKAFEYMVKTASFDKIDYVLGIPSPRKIAFNKIKGEGGTTGVQLIMKAQSNLYDIVNPNKYYTVLEVEQEWRPAFGLFYSAGGYLGSGHGDVSFHDITYISIPDSMNLDESLLSYSSPKVFFRDEYSKIKQKIKNMVCGKGESKTIMQVPKNALALGDCKITTVVTFPSYLAIDIKNYLTPSKSIENAYVENANNFMQAPWTNSNFKSEDPIKEVLRLESLVKLVRGIPHLLIKDQVKDKDSTLPKKVYLGESNAINRGNLFNIKIHIIRATRPLTNKELEKEVSSGKFEVYNMLNPKSNSSKIKEDGVFMNKIKLMKYGPVDKTTIESDITPRFFENGKQVFKFLFVKPKEEN